MDDIKKIVHDSTKLKIVNRILDYSEELLALSSDALSKNKDKYMAKEYLYASIVLKNLAEEVIDTDYEEVCLFSDDGGSSC